MTTPLSETELDQLSEFLDGLASPDAMNIERLDGFFCALVIGPDAVMPSEYWPRIVGEEHAESSATFDSMEQAQTVMSLVTRHWNRIAETLQADEIYVPILLEGDDGLARKVGSGRGAPRLTLTLRDGLTSPPAEGQANAAIHRQTTGQAVGRLRPDLASL